MVAAHTSHKDVIKKRAAFLNAAKGHYIPRNAFVMQCNIKVGARTDVQAAAARLEGSKPQDSKPQVANPRVGFTVTRKVGNAVVRNRVRRRLREAVRHTDVRLFEAFHDYVLVGRSPALEIEFPDLCADIEATLKKFSRGQGKVSRPPHSKIRSTKIKSKAKTGQ